MLKDQIRTFTRRDFLKLGTLGVGASLAAGCTPFLDALGTPTPIPTRTPPSTITPYPTLIAETSERIETSIPHVEIITRKVAFEDATSLIDQARRIRLRGDEIPKVWDADWFADISEGSTVSPENGLIAYYNSREEKLYTGFGYAGREPEILGWENIEIGGADTFADYPLTGRNTLRALFTEVPGKFGYIAYGRRGGEEEKAFVFVDMAKSEKTFIKFKHYEDQRHFIKFEFDISEQANALAINQVLYEDIPEKGVYILNTEDWQLVKFIPEHINYMQISEDGGLIYSSTGPGFTSTIINVSAGEVELIDWEAAGVGGNPSRPRWYEVLSPNFKYISSPVELFSSGGGFLPDSSTFTSNIVKTPRGFVRVMRGNVDRITNDGILYFWNGETFNLND